MRLFRPDARETNGLLIVGFLSIGYALYIRYLAIEPATVANTCMEVKSWLCTTRAAMIQLFMWSVFGWVAMALAVANLVRPNVWLFAAALLFASFGIVLYNVTASSVAVALLILSFARRAPE